MRLACLEKKPGLRFTTFAAVRVIVITGEEAVDRQARSKGFVYGLNLRTGLAAASDIGLIGNNNQRNTQPFEVSKGERRVGENVEFRHIPRRIGFSVANRGSVQYTITIEKDGAALAFVHGIQRIDSHFVCARWISGWETIRCQITA